MSELEIIEKLAALEHRQWEVWSRAVIAELLNGSRFPRDERTIADQVFKMHQRWLPLWVDYDDLSEDVKEKDREWAREAFDIVKEAGQ